MSEQRWGHTATEDVADLLAEVARLHEEARWRLVSEEPPAHRQRVEVWPFGYGCAEKVVGIVCWEPRSAINYGYTHWRPLPSVPNRRDADDAGERTYRGRE